MLVETQEWPGLQIFDEGKEKVVDLLRAVIELGGLPYHRYVLIRYLACKQNKNNFKWGHFYHNRVYNSTGLSEHFLKTPIINKYIGLDDV